MNESAHEGADTDESTGRELWQIRPVDTLAGISSCTSPFSPLHNRYCDSKGGRSVVCIARLATFRVSLRRSPCLLRCGRGIRTHTAATAGSEEARQRSGASSPDRRKPGEAVKSVGDCERQLPSGISRSIVERGDRGE